MKVGFIGLGTMGARMAANIQKAGYDLTVHDARAASAEPFVARGAVFADTPRDLAAACDVVFTSLPGPPEVEAVALGPDGLMEGVRPGMVYFDLSTNAQSTILKIAGAFSAKGAHVLDAPVSGGPRGAETANLALWIGGDRAVFEQHRDLLNAIGDQPYYVGPTGHATVAKLVHNCASYAITIVLGECFTMGVKAGVDPLVLFEAARRGSIGRRRTFDGLVSQFLPGVYDPPNFALKLAHKDVVLATSAGREHNVPMRLCNLALEDMTEALGRGWGDRDSRSPMLIQQERAGVEVKVPVEDIRRSLAADTSTLQSYADRLPAAPKAKLEKAG